MDPITIAFGVIAFAVVRGLVEPPKPQKPKEEYDVEFKGKVTKK